MKMIPDSAEDIDISWLTSALSERFPGVDIADFKIEKNQEVTNHHVHLHVDYHVHAGAPEKLFCKFLPCDPQRKQTVANTHMGLRESRFYKEIAPTLSVDMRIPAIYCARFNEKDDSFVLLMEHIIASGCTISDGTQTVSVDSAARVLEELALLHLEFETVAARNARIPWLTEKLFNGARRNHYAPKLISYGLEHHRHRLSRGFAELSEIYLQKTDQLHDLWTEGPKTLIHGDLHIGNLFDDHGRTGFLDWGIISVGTPVRDLSYFLIMSLSTADRRSQQQHLIKHYLDIINSSTSISIDFDTAWRGHQLHAAYGVPACCQIITFPEDATDQRKVFANAFLARAQEAIDDLEVVDFIKRL